MPFERESHDKNFTIIDNSIFLNKRLSLKARGLLSTLLSLPDDWEFTRKGIYSLCKDGKSSIDTAIYELEENGYLIINKKRNSLGKFCYYYTVIEKP